MGKRSRRKRSLLGRRGSRPSLTENPSPEPAEPDEDSEDERAADPSVPDDSTSDDADSGNSASEESEESEESQEPGIPEEPSEPEEPGEPEEPPPPREPFVPLPHWPAPRYVARRKMMRGHVRPPQDEPLMTEREMHLVFGLAAMATGFVLVGLLGLVLLYVAFGDEVFRAVNELFSVVAP